MASAHTNAGSYMKLKEDYKMICTWLQHLDIREHLDFEINYETIAILSSLMHRSMQADEDCVKMLETAEWKSKEYEAEAKRLDTSIKSLLAVSDDYLEEAYTTSLDFTQIAVFLDMEEALNASHDSAQIAVLLDMDDVTEENYEVQMHKLAKELLDVRLKAKLLENSTKMWTEKNEELAKQIENHETILESLNKARSVEMAENAAKMESMKFLSAKQKEYESKIDSYEKASMANGMNPSLTHETLAKEYKHLQSLQKEVSEMEAKLHGYKNLPPDISLAKVTIAEAKSDLQKLNEEVQRRLNNVL